MSARLLFSAFVVTAACGRGDTPKTADPVPVHNDEKAIVTSTELTISARWNGHIRLSDDADVAARTVRDEAGYDALLAELPAERIQMKQPAPPSDDPLRQRPAIDFATQMLIVVAFPATLERPEIARVTADDGRLVVAYVPPPNTPHARPNGIGGYSAVLVPRTDGELELVAPVVITDEAGVAAAVDQLVTLRGTLTRTKLPTILGVDVDEGDADPDTTAEATGWLRKDEVTQAELDAELAERGQFANRGAGTFWRLVAPTGDRLAPARRVFAE